MLTLPSPLELTWTHPTTTTTGTQTGFRLWVLFWWRRSPTHSPGWFGGDLLTDTSCFHSGQPEVEATVHVPVSDGRMMKLRK